jgi:uncharacterized protein with WD repeat
VTRPRLLSLVTIDEQPVFGAAFTPGSEVLVTAGGSGALVRWDLAGLRRPQMLDGHLACVWSVAVSPDGKFLASASGEWHQPLNAGELFVWDATTGARCRVLEGHTALIFSVAFAPDGKLLASAGWDGTVRLWDPETGQPRKVLRKHQGPVRFVTFSPDGRTLVSGGFDGTVRLWDPDTGAQRAVLDATGYKVNCVAFSPDGRFLAAAENPAIDSPLPGGAGPGRIRLWDTATWTERAVLTGARGMVLCVAFSPDGRVLATASADGVIRLWEAASWTVRAEFRGHRDRVSALAFGPGGRLFSGSLDTTVLAWDVRPPRPEADGAIGAAWDDLTQGDAALAFRAQGRLRAAPAEAVALFAARLEPARAVDPKRVAGLIADLDSPQFATRDRAAEALRQLGRPAAAALREAREKSASAEVRRRGGNLLAELEESGTPPEELRALRAVEVLEWLDTPEARRLLAQWAGGERGAVLTRAAAAALERLTPPPGDGK